MPTNRKTTKESVTLTMAQAEALAAVRRGEVSFSGDGSGDGSLWVAPEGVSHSSLEVLRQGRFVREWRAADGGERDSRVRLTGAGLKISASLR